jgi:uncharacterized protein YjiS (DUF1127 family)
MTALRAVQRPILSGLAPFHLAGLKAALAAPLELLSLWRRPRRLRDDLHRLLLVGPHVVEDIGLTPAQALEEASKPFWRA